MAPYERTAQPSTWFYVDANTTDSYTTNLSSWRGCWTDPLIDRNGKKPGGQLAAFFCRILKSAVKPAAVYAQKTVTYFCTAPPSGIGVRNFSKRFLDE